MKEQTAEQRPKRSGMKMVALEERDYAIWKEKYEQARINTAKCLKRPGVLIEVAAQHPLLDGKWPNEEFEKRLLLGKEIYLRKRSGGESVKIFVPGSLHRFEGVVDDLSLSRAGTNFLIEQGVPIEDVYGDDANLKFKGAEGVYNSSDECYVATQLFEELSYGKLHCVCSSAQMMRKALSYIQFGMLPHFHTVTTDKMYHNYIDEIFKAIPILIRDGNGLQGNSEAGEQMRKLRNPSYDKRYTEL